MALSCTSFLRGLKESPASLQGLGLPLKEGRHDIVDLVLRCRSAQLPHHEPQFLGFLLGAQASDEGTNGLGGDKAPAAFSLALLGPPPLKLFRIPALLREHHLCNPY
jgi:hypothetical protein